MLITTIYKSTAILKTHVLRSPKNIGIPQWSMSPKDLRVGPELHLNFLTLFKSLKLKKAELYHAQILYVIR